MKKLLTGCVLIASALAIHAAGTDTSKAMSEHNNMATFLAADTLPKKDTTGKDSMYQSSVAYAAFDTLPKKDTARKDSLFASAVAYRLITDTVPTRDTTMKDSTLQLVAFNR